MDLKKNVTNKQQDTAQGVTNTAGDQFVQVANGAGNTPVDVIWQPGDTVATVLQRAGITIEKGRTATLCSRRVRHPETTEVKPGESIVIAGKPSNG